jgi:alpha-glucoside transport system permease protein
MSVDEAVVVAAEGAPDPAGVHAGVQRKPAKTHQGLATLVIVVMSILWALPVLGFFITSLRSKAAADDTGWWTVFVHPSLTFSNYINVLFHGGANIQGGGLFPYAMNSLAIAIPATIIPIIVASMAAYSLSWVRFKSADTVYFIIFGLQVVPLQMSLVPLLQLYSHGAHIGGFPIFPNLNLHGSIAEVWISHTMFSMPLAVFLLYNFIAQLPNELIEAARVDGAGYLYIYRRVVMPLSLPAVASFTIFQFLWVWNDLLIGLTFSAKNATAQPITVQLQQLSGTFGSHLDLLTAGGFVTIIIPMIVFFSLQRYFVRGLLAGSVKG